MQYERSIGWPPWTPGVKWLCIANTAVFLLHAIFVGVTHDEMLLPRWFGVSGSNLIEGYGAGILRLLSYQFLHAFASPGHWFFNMVCLYFMGSAVEQRIGTRPLVALYLMGGLVGGLLEVALELLVGQDTLVIGASGACYAIIIYLACIEPGARVIFIIIPMTMRVLAWVLVGFGVYMTYVNLLGTRRDPTAHGAHLGGALWGYLAYRHRIEPARLLRGWEAWRARRAAKQEVAGEATLNELLDKVHRQGLTSLTAAERRFLDKRSREMRRP